MNRNNVLSLAAVALFLACTPPPPPGGLDTTCTMGAATVTMTTLYSSFIKDKCATPCHYPMMGGAPAGSGYDYGDYSTLDETYKMVGKLSVYKGPHATLKIVDNDTAKTTADRLANSTLWLKVSAPAAMTAAFKGPNGEVTQAPMPQTGDRLTDAELKSIKDFLCTGATK